ncbi:hypothetical protein [Streptomyces sp. NPDC012510]|uniref:hypothetical protein n=1 Tax=Streptomyces sp. NPDC012510 TaxID=3364838 RepID=UPI0036E88345
MPSGGAVRAVPRLPTYLRATPLERGVANEVLRLPPGGSDTTGIGVCSRCGSATCENHARVRQVQVTRQIGMGAAHGRIPAPRVVCHTYDMAETAH